MPLEISDDIRQAKDDGDKTEGDQYNDDVCDPNVSSQDLSFFMCPIVLAKIWNIQG